MQIKHSESAVQSFIGDEVSPQQLFHHQLLRLICTVPVFSLQILISILFRFGHAHADGRPFMPLAEQRLRDSLLFGNERIDYIM